MPKNVNHFARQTASIVLVCMFLLVGCNLKSRYGKFQGITNVAPRGDPPANLLVWSRSDINKVLVTASDVGFDDSQVYILNILTGERKIVAITDQGIINGLTWSPDEEKVVLDIFSSTRGYENYEGLWIWNAKSDSLEFLTNRGRATWDPSGKKIAILESRESEGIDILTIINTESNDKELLTVGEIRSIGYPRGADWSPDGQYLVISLGDPKSSIGVNLYIYDTITHSMVRMTDEGDNYHPTWSPLGDKIAYVKHTKGKTTDSLHLIKPDGSCDVEIPNIDWILSLSWTSDGKMLGFIGPDGIYTVDLVEVIGKDKYLDLCR
jgi:Tol biopolymer transport system component